MLALVAAFFGGMIARRIGLPVLLGYILAGMLIGPYTPGPIAASERVDLLANLGVGFLMFALGVEFSFRDLLRVKRVALITGGVQIPLTILVGYGAGTAFGWSWRASLILGGAFAISSSIVALKLLMGRGEGNSPQARIALGVGVIQDLSIVPMVAVVHALAGDEEQLPREIGLALFEGLAMILAVAIIGTKIVPRLFDLVARTQSRELFILAVVMIAFGGAWAGERAGLSLALGAFLAGLVVSESEYDSRVLADIIPFRDLFSTIFFVSIGMLVDPVFLWDHRWILLAGLAVLIVGKMLIFGATLLALRIDHRTATITAVLMAQMAEFSFILANEGRRESLVSNEQYSLILAMALGSILIVPLLIQAAPAFANVAERLPLVTARETALVGGHSPEVELCDHVIVCGYGRVGRELGQALQKSGIPFAAIDLNAPRIRDLRGAGVLALYGDASQVTLLERAHVGQARVLAITYPDFVMARAAMDIARNLNPDIQIIARATASGEIGPLDAHGAEEIVQPEFEAGLEFVRQTMAWCDVEPAVIIDLVERRRTAFYEENEPAAIPTDPVGPAGVSDADHDSGPGSHSSSR